jgi:hypothetical protein
VGGGREATGLGLGLGWGRRCGQGREAEWVGGGQGAGVATQLLGYGYSGPCVFSNPDEGPS